MNEDSPWNQELNAAKFPSTYCSNHSHYSYPQISSKMMANLATKFQWRLSTKSTYLLAKQTPNINNMPQFNEWKGLWRAKIHGRHKLLIWKLVWDMLTTSANLARRFPINSTSCCLCFNEDETQEHIFLQCPFSRILWSRLKFEWTNSFALQFVQSQQLRTQIQFATKIVP